MKKLKYCIVLKKDPD